MTYLSQELTLMRVRVRMGVRVRVFVRVRVRVRALMLVMGSVLLVAAGASHSRDPEAGKALAGAWAMYRTPMSLSQLPKIPHLAGQPAIYLVEQLINYRSKKREYEVMGVIAKTLTDAEIDNLAAGYAFKQISISPNNPPPGRKRAFAQLTW